MDDFPVAHVYHPYHAIETVNGDPTVYTMNIIEGKTQFVVATDKELQLIDSSDPESCDGQIFEVEKNRIKQYLKDISRAKSVALNLLGNELLILRNSHKRILEKHQGVVDVPNVLVIFSGEHPPGDLCGLCRGIYNSPEMQDADPCLINHPRCSCRGQIYCRECIATAFRYSNLCPFCRGKIGGLSPERIAEKEAALRVELSTAQKRYDNKMFALKKPQAVLAKRLVELAPYQEYMSIRLLLNQLGIKFPPALIAGYDYIERSQKPPQPLDKIPKVKQDGKSKATSAKLEMIDVVSQPFLNLLTNIAAHTKITRRLWNEKRDGAALLGLRCLVKFCIRALDSIKSTNTSFSVKKMLETLLKNSYEALDNMRSHFDATDTPLNILGMDCTPEMSSDILSRLKQLITTNSVSENENWLNISLEGVERLQAMHDQSQHPKNIATCHEAELAARYSVFIIIRRVSGWLEDKNRQVAPELKPLLQDLVENSFRTLAMTDWNQVGFLAGEGVFLSGNEPTISNNTLFESYKERHLWCRINEMIFLGRRCSGAYNICDTARIEEMVASVITLPHPFSSDEYFHDLATIVEPPPGSEYGAVVMNL